MMIKSIVQLSSWALDLWVTSSAKLRT